MACIPAIVCDIDGVLYSGGEIRGNSPEVFKNLLSSGKIPFVLLTNGGMVTESQKAHDLN